MITFFKNQIQGQYQLTYQVGFLPLRTVVSFNKTQIYIPMMDENFNVIKDEIGWTSGGLSGSYSLKIIPLGLTQDWIT